MEMTTVADVLCFSVCKSDLHSGIRSNGFAKFKTWNPDWG